VRTSIIKGFSDNYGSNVFVLFMNTLKLLLKLESNCVLRCTRNKYSTANFTSNTFCTHASSALMATIGSCKLEMGYCYLIDNYQSKLKVNTKTDCWEYRIDYKKKKQGRIDHGRIVVRPDWHEAGLFKGRIISKSKSSPQKKIYGFHHNLVDRYEISISQMTMDILLFT